MSNTIEELSLEVERLKLRNKELEIEVKNLSSKDRRKFIDALVDEAFIGILGALKIYESDTLFTKAGNKRRGLDAFCEEHPVTDSRLYAIARGDEELTVDYAIRIAKGLKRWKGKPDATIPEGFKASRSKDALEFDKDALMIFFVEMASH